MTFRQLEYIIAVDRHRNFKRAAIDCDVAQSTLSKEIQRLESEFDVIIFDRSRKPVVPTLKGIELIKKAKDLRLQQRQFTQIALERENEISGQLHLAIAEIIAPYITPLFIKSISTKYPKLHLKIYELSDRRIEDYLINEEVDAALLVSPSLIHGYYEQKIYEEELCLYSTVPLIEQGNRLSIQEVDFNNLSLHEDIRDILIRQMDSLEGNSSQALKKSKIKYVKGNLETLRNIIDYNGGAMLLPKIALKYLTPKNMEKIYFFNEKTPKLDVSLVTSRGFQKQRIIKGLIKEISATLTKSDIDPKP